MLRFAHRLGTVQQKVKLGFETALEIESQAKIEIFASVAIVISPRSLTIRRRVVPVDVDRAN